MNASVYGWAARGVLLGGFVILGVLAVSLLGQQRSASPPALLPKVAAAENGDSGTPRQFDDRFQVVDTESVVTTTSTSVAISTSTTTIQPRTTTSEVAPVSIPPAPVVMVPTTVVPTTVVPTTVVPTTVVPTTVVPTTVVPTTVVPTTVASTIFEFRPSQGPSTTACLSSSTSEAQTKAQYRIVVGSGETTVQISGVETGPISTTWTWLTPAESMGEEDQPTGMIKASVSISASGFQEDSDC